MKSLAESLFDKDLVEKEFTFGDHYRVKGVYVVDDDYKQGGQSYKTEKDDHAWLLNTIKLNALKKKFHTPVEIDNRSARDTDTREFLVGWPAGEDFCKDIGYLVAAINTIPYVGKENDDYPHTGVLARDVYNTLSPYFKNMRGDNRYGRGGSYSISKPSWMSDNVIIFEFWRKDMECKIVFEGI